MENVVEMLQRAQSKMSAILNTMSDDERKIYNDTLEKLGNKDMDIVKTISENITEINKAKNDFSKFNS